MQSTGQTSTQDRSLMSMQGSAMMYVTGDAQFYWRLAMGCDRERSNPGDSDGRAAEPSRPPCLGHQFLDDLRRPLLERILHQHLVEAGLVRAAHPRRVCVPAEAEDW